MLDPQNHEAQPGEGRIAPVGGARLPAAELVLGGAFDEYAPEQIATIYNDLIVQGAESAALVSREDWRGRQTAAPAEARANNR